MGIVGVALWLHMGVVEPQRMVVHLVFSHGGSMQAMGGVCLRARCCWFTWSGGVYGVGSAHFIGVNCSIFNLHVIFLCGLGGFG